MRIVRSQLMWQILIARAGDLASLSGSFLPGGNFPGFASGWNRPRLSRVSPL
jgi:hypothetical protein